MFSFNAGVRPSSTAISSQHLLGQARAYQAMGNLEEAKKSYTEAVNKAKTEHEKKPSDRQVKKAFYEIRKEFFTFLSGLQEPAAAANLGEHSSASPTPNQFPSISQNDAPPQRPLSAQRAQDASNALSNGIDPDFFEKQPSPSESSSAHMATPAQEKNAQVEYLFEKALSTLGSLDLPNKPSLFLVYAHNNANLAYGKANANTSKYLIEKLSQIRVNVYSDQTPMGQPTSRAAESQKKDGKLEDILTSQLCLLPTRLRDDVEPVDKVVVCCSEVLGKYLKWPHYGTFYQKLQEAYCKDCEQKGTSTIREVVKAFSQGKEYKEGFHHVLTEMAFLQIRAEQLRDQHGIIPVSLTPKSAKQCLEHFIPQTTVRMEDIPRFEAQVQAGGEVYPNQSRHLVLFKLIERLLVSSDEAQTFLNKFWQGYDRCISRLESESSSLGWSEFTVLVDGIFKNIQIEQHRNQAWNLSETRILHTKIVQELLPPKLSLINLREALYQHYQLSNLSIQRIAGDKMSLADCYINLAIVESQAQREKDKEELEKQAVNFERLPSSERQRLEATNPNKLIALEKLFDKQKLRDGSKGIPKRILIQGRAGIGKTTLCKKLVYEYHQNGLWQDQFESVLWIPLRQLKTYAPKRLEDLFCTQYFAGYESSQAQALSKVFYAHQGKTLFILDGLDEVVGELNEGRPLKDFLQILLNQAHVVITSRPAGVNANLLDRLDLELETVGFSPANVRTYIEKFVPASNQAVIQQFIHRTPLIQGLVNIPIQLDALCYSWDRLPENKAVTMAVLYEAMADKLWRKDGVRLEKQDKGNTLAPNIIQISSKAKLEKLMADEIHYFGYLAFKGLEEGKIEFSLEKLDQCQTELENIFSGKELPFSFTADLKKTSFLHTADAERPEAERHYHFLHLTFQEFFAAKFLVRHLQSYAEVNRGSTPAHVVLKGLGIILSRDELEAFIDQHKYDPQYEIVWWMVAGLLQRGTVLEEFFERLEKAPRDLIGMRHQQVMLGCLNEARKRLEAMTIAQLEKKAMQWLDFEMENGLSDYSLLGSQRIFPEHLLLKSLIQVDRQKKKKVIATLGVHSALSDGAVLALASFLKDENGDIKSAAASALRNQKTLSDSILQALFDALKDENDDVRFAVAKTLVMQKEISEATLKILSNSLKDKKLGVKLLVVHALRKSGEQKMLPESVLRNLIEALKNDMVLHRLGSKVLNEQRELPHTILQDLLGALKNEENNKYLRTAAVWALSGQEMLSESILQALAIALKDKNIGVKCAVIEALGERKVLPEVALHALIEASTDRSEYVRTEVVRALGKQKVFSEIAFQTLTAAFLKDKNWRVRDEATLVLNNHKALPSSALQSLIEASTDQDEYVRANVVRILGKQKYLSQTAFQTLVEALKDEKRSVQDAAAKILVNRRTLPKDLPQALNKTLENENNSVRPALIKALRRQIKSHTLYEFIENLKDENRDIRSQAAEALSKQNELPEVAIQALIETSTDQDEYVRSKVAMALGEQRALSEPAFRALAVALKDKNWIVRSSSVKALGKQPMLPDFILQMLIEALVDQEESIRDTAVRAVTEHLAQFLTMQPDFTSEQIQILYIHGFVPLSCRSIAFMVIQNGQLCFYTETGPGQPIHLSDEQSQMITEAFKAAQAEAGLTSLLEEPPV